MLTLICTTPPYMDLYGYEFRVKLKQARPTIQILTQQKNIPNGPNNGPPLKSKKIAFKR